VSLAASVSQTFSGATYTMELTVPRAELLARAWAGAQDAAGQMKVGRPGTPVLVLPVGDGDPVQVRVGVFHGGSVYDREGRQFQADMRTGGVYVHFSGDDLVGDSQRQAMVDWLAEHGYDSTGEPWAVLAAGGVEEVRWPVRPVRDSESFIGRHGVRVAIPDPDGCLVADQEIHDRTVERIPELIGRFEAGTARPNTLERICMEALAAARLAQIPTPDDPAVIRWLTLAGRAGLAELTCRATGSPLELELDPAREDPRSRLAAAPGTGARPHHRGRRSGRQHRFHHRGRPWHDRPGTPANRLSGLGIEDFHGDDLVVGRVRAADDVPFRGRAGSQRDVDVDVWTFERGRADWPRTRSGRFARASGQIVRARAVARVAVGQRN